MPTEQVPVLTELGQVPTEQVLVLTELGPVSTERVLVSHKPARDKELGTAAVGSTPE